MSDDWVLTTFGEVLTSVSRSRKVAVTDLEEIPYAGVRWNAEGVYHRDTVSTEGITGKAVYRIEKDDVVYNHMWPTKAAFGVVKDDTAGCYVTNHFPLFTVKPHFAIPSFIEATFQYPEFQAEAARRAVGTTERKQISNAAFASLPIWVPPLSVQERIVEIIGAVDDQIAALSVETETLAAVLRRRRADLMTDGSVEAVRAEHAFDFSTGVRRTPDRASGPYMTPYLRSANVGYGTLDLSDVLEMNYEPAEREKFGLRYGDVVVSEGSASANAVGMPAMWRDELPGPVCTQMTLLRLRAMDEICIPEFVFHWSMWAYESRAFLDIAGGTNIKHISAKRAKGMVVRLPPLDRQREMSVELDTMEVALASARAETARLREVKAGLLPRLLNRTIDIKSAELLEV
ncbi:restriction endonuclease subunit S [Streptomyces sp. WAC01490]|uniref:restriction endonuclease subunit S n=1 Tax=unclassified Streptomyces TaxID=2593676 RepID=UPI003F32994F